MSIKFSEQVSEDAPDLPKKRVKPRTELRAAYLKSQAETTHLGQSNSPVAKFPDGLDKPDWSKYLNQFDKDPVIHWRVVTGPLEQHSFHHTRVARCIVQQPRILMQSVVAAQQVTLEESPHAPSVESVQSKSA